MEVFISHKQEDYATALSVYNAFLKNNITAYLDLLDNSITGDGKELTEHIKKRLNECTDIIVVMSEETKRSWWVPFEIGMSAQVDMPTASFLKSNVELPSYLSYWPRLKTTSDIDTYVAVRQKTEQIIHKQYGYRRSDAIRTVETSKFYEALKKELR